MFDIASLDTQTRSEAGVAMPLLHPKSGAPILDKEGKAVTISLLGPNSQTSKTLQRTLSTRRAEMQARGVAMTDDDFARERFEFLTAVTTGWSFDTMDGKPFPFSAENCQRFWSDVRWEWLQSRAWQFAQSDGNYLPSL